MDKTLHQKGSWHIEKLTLGQRGQSLVRYELQMEEAKARLSRMLNMPVCQLSRDSPVASLSSLLPGEA